MPVVEIPVFDPTGAARSFDLGGELRGHFAAMAVPQLVENAAMLVEDSMMRVNQPEQILGLRVLFRQPRRAIGVVIRQDDVFGGNRSIQHFDTDGNRNFGSTAACDNSSFVGSSALAVFGIQTSIQNACVR